MWGLHYRDFNCWQVAWQNKNGFVEQNSAEGLTTKLNGSSVVSLQSSSIWLHVKCSFLFQPEMPLRSAPRNGAAYYVKPDMTY